MSVLEMKALAFEKLAALQSEADIQEILNYLEKLNSNDKIKLSVIEHAVSIMNERSSVLEKLAQ
jgi:ABC-type branched-subunit amino acid transport system ATPase component